MNLSDPQQIHGYSYSNNNPATLSDPDGLEPRPWHEPGKGFSDFDDETIYAYGTGMDGWDTGWGGGSGGSSTSGTGTTGPAADGPTEDEIAKAREVMSKSITDVALELGWEALKDFVGWNDLMGCLNADIGGCAMLALGILPVGKGLKAVKAIYKIIDGVISLTKKIKWAKGVISRLKGAASVADEACTINSFTSGTLVLLADGTSKPIEEVELGDKVLAADEDTGESGARRVVALISGDGLKDLVAITLAADDGAAGSVTATEGHPFWVPALDAWVDAGDLQPGQWLQTSAGTHVQVKQVKHETRRQQVYNLTVANWHTYYVLAGATPVLVHNCNISMDEALNRGVAHVGDNATVVRSGSGGVQFMSVTTDEAGNSVRKIARFDVNPNSNHVQKLGPHLNLETQINGKTVTSGPLKDPHTAIDPSTIRPGDYWP